MITVRFFQISGKYHDFDMDKCQDQLNIISDSERTTIVLCDGASSSPFGKLAAKETSKIIGQNLHENFERYLYNIIPDTKRRLTQLTDNKLMQVAKKMNLDARLLATTILAVSMDNEGNFIGIHLGDGSIQCNIKGKNQLLTVSSPQNGDHPNTTYLTMNCPLFFYMRFYRWQEPDTTRIILMSDGMDCIQNEITPDLFLPTNSDLLHQKMKTAESYDDMSYVLCEFGD